MAALTIAVLSDPHFFLKDEKSSEAHSHLPVDAHGDLVVHARGVNKNPIDDLKALIADQGLRADVVLCPGDITTRASGTALSAGWRNLVDLAQDLDATLLCAATGNHDVDSRSQKTMVAANPIRNLSLMTGPIESLKLLTPSYPAFRRDTACVTTDHRAAQSRYFGESFVLLDHDPRFRVLAFNSCADHGHDAHEYERGTAPSSALRWVKEDVEALNQVKVNLLLVHHPLLSQSTQDGDQYSFQAGGDHLLKVIEGAADDWLVINGHKHHGELKNGPSTTGVNVTLFSAASFSAVVESQAEGSENQFYLIDLERDHDDRLLGNLRTWNWHVGNRWRKAPPGRHAGVYDDCGFGNPRKPQQLAADIYSHFNTGTRNWVDLRSAMPELAYVLPDALRATRHLLRKNHQLIIEVDEQGFYVAISKEAS